MSSDTLFGSKYIGLGRVLELMGVLGCMPSTPIRIAPSTWSARNTLYMSIVKINSLSLCAEIRVQHLTYLDLGIYLGHPLLGPYITQIRGWLSLDSNLIQPDLFYSREYFETLMYFLDLFQIRIIRKIDFVIQPHSSFQVKPSRVTTITPFLQ